MIDCHCITHVSPTWESESIAIFKLLEQARFPLSIPIKDAFDMIVKIAKSGNAPPPTLAFEHVTGTSITNSGLSGRLISAIIVDDYAKSTGFRKTGATPDDQLESDTMEITDGTPMNDSDVVIIFK